MTAKLVESIWDWLWQNIGLSQKEDCDNLDLSSVATKFLDEQILPNGQCKPLILPIMRICMPFMYKDIENNNFDELKYVQLSESGRRERKRQPQPMPQLVLQQFAAKLKQAMIEKMVPEQEKPSKDNVDNKRRQRDSVDAINAYTSLGEVKEDNLASKRLKRTEKGLEGNSGSSQTFGNDHISAGVTPPSLDLLIGAEVAHSASAPTEDSEKQLYKKQRDGLLLQVNKLSSFINILREKLGKQSLTKEELFSKATAVNITEDW